MSRNAFSTNQGTNEDDSQSDPHPEAGVFGNQTMRNSGQKDRRDTERVSTTIPQRKKSKNTQKRTRVPIEGISHLTLHSTHFLQATSQKTKGSFNRIATI